MRLDGLYTYLNIACLLLQFEVRYDDCIGIVQGYKVRNNVRKSSKIFHIGFAFLLEKDVIINGDDG